MLRLSRNTNLPPGAGRVSLADLPSLLRMGGARAASARVVGLSGEGPEAERLRDLGFCEGTVVAFSRHAPLRDPLCFRLRGSEICLRATEARRVLIEVLDPSLA